MRTLKILILPALCLSLSACPSKNNKAAKKTTIKKYVILGDPLNIIKGAKLDTSGAFDTLSKESIISAHAGVQFADKQEAVTKVSTQESLEKSEAPEKEFTPPETIDFDIIQHDKDTLIFKRTSSAEFPSFSLTRDSSGRLQFADIEDKTMTGNLIHFSKSEDETQFSLLFYIYNTKNKSNNLAALYVTNKFVPVQPGTTKKPYSYLEGPGVKFAWDEKKSITLEICGDIDSNIQKTIEKSVAEWNHALTGVRNFSTKKATEFHPFSDFRQNCIYFIDDLIVDADLSAGTLGEAFIPRDYFKTTIIDSDILIYKKEFEKSGVAFTDQATRADLYFTVLHEVGHFLGLDHIFDDNIKSIMGYDFSIETKLYPYDIEAIRALYE